MKKSFGIYIILAFGSFTFLSGCSLFQEKGVDMPQLSTESFYYDIDEINPADKEFPGGRGEDELILYTPGYGEMTGTNTWGTEAIVIEGTVQNIGGNNSVIPKNGFILSGHGKSARWIAEKLFAGVEIRIDGKKIVAEITPDTFLKYGSSLIDERSDILENTGKDSSISCNNLKSLKRKFSRYKKDSLKASKKGDRKKSLLFARKALDTAHRYFYNSHPSPGTEIRAVWYRLQEKSPEELEITIKKLADAGFNCICPETIYWGYAIYPDAHPDLGQNPAFIGWDPLKELCRICHEYNIKVIPWVEVFFIGFKESPLVKNKSEWLALSRNGKYPSVNEAGYYYFSPANEDVHDFWLEVYEYMLKNYKIDGLQLDYIRYPSILSWENGYCYAPGSREKFYNEHEKDPASFTPENDPENWEKWKQFRKNQVTEFVKKVHDLVKNIRPDVKISADVFGVPEEALEKKFQDWGTWLEKGYLDQIYSMTYTTDAKQVEKECRHLVQQLPEKTKGIIGLGPFLGLGPKQLLDEVQAARDAGSDGVCFFCLESMTDDQMNALKAGPFRIKAAFP
jgi:uncharacterized lipoprotein YddW (UPF0748 family)